jgi:hypothetical protein
MPGRNPEPSPTTTESLVPVEMHVVMLMPPGKVHNVAAAVAVAFEDEKYGCAVSGTGHVVPVVPPVAMVTRVDWPGTHAPGASADDGALF